MTVSYARSIFIVPQSACVVNRNRYFSAALGKELGIADNEWDTLQIDRFNEAIAEYRKSGKADAYKAKAAAVEKAKAIPETDAKKKMRWNRGERI